MICQFSVNSFSVAKVLQTAFFRLKKAPEPASFQEKRTWCKTAPKNFYFPLDSPVSVDKHGENRRALRHVHISHAALHFQAYAAVEQGVPALSHGDEIQRRHREIHIPTVNPAVPELAVVQVLHFVDPALHLLAAGHGLGGHGSHRQIHQPFVILDNQLTGIFKPTVRHGKVVMVFDLLPVNDKREVIAAVLEVVADIPAMKIPVPGKDLLETHPPLLFSEALHKLIRESGRQRPQGVLFDLHRRDVLILHILLQDFHLVAAFLRQLFPGYGQDGFPIFLPFHYILFFQSIQRTGDRPFGGSKDSGRIRHRALFRLRFQTATAGFETASMFQA